MPSDSGRQAGTETYRGHKLPDGMTPDLLDRLALLFVEYERGEFEGFETDAAIRAFAISRGLPA
jgi:hypothetical protein